jgi:hypothetical protein
MKYAVEMGSCALIYIKSFKRLVHSFKSCLGGGGLMVGFTEKHIMVIS